MPKLAVKLKVGDKVTIGRHGRKQWTIISIVADRVNVKDPDGVVSEVGIAYLQPASSKQCRDEELQKQKEGKKRSDPTQSKGEAGAHSAAKPTPPATALISNLLEPYFISATASPHIIVVARAGTGKTTTMVEGLKYIRGLSTTITPSPQQAAVWEAMRQSKGVRSICFCAFNRSIAAELKRRVPADCDALTMHGMGMRAVRKTFRLLDGDNAVNEYRVLMILTEILKGTTEQQAQFALRKEKPVVCKAVKELVDLCKMNLTELHPRDPTGLTTTAEEWNYSTLDKMVSHYDIQLTDDPPKGRYASQSTGKSHREEIYSLVPLVIERCKDVAKDGCIDYADMIWLPIVLNLPMWRYDLLLGDEVQDWNRCQQALAKKAGDRLILVGDPRQAIYGFAGADAESMSRLENELKATAYGCVVLPLTVTRRCGRAIVAEANTIVKDFEAHPSNPEGQVLEARYPIQRSSGQLTNGVQETHELKLENTYIPLVHDGDMVLCRVNAPLVNQCLRFIKLGKKAFVQGRDIGKGLIALLEKFSATSVEELVTLLGAWREQEVAKESGKPNPSESKIQSVVDRHDCLICFTEEAKSIQEIKSRIETIFNDQGSGIRLSSIHKAKGLEARSVFFLRPSVIYGPKCKTKWQAEQEENLGYVGITRAIETLTWVT